MTAVTTLCCRHCTGAFGAAARAESINADIQSAIARARGFRTFAHLRTMVYLLKRRLALPRSPYAAAVAGSR